jgi:four helix bundle protein
MELVEQVYRSTQVLPSTEMYGLRNQVRRCVVSIPSNIAEGHAREYSKEYLYHLSVAQGSIAELQTQIEIARRLGYLSNEQAQQISEQALSLTRQLYSLRNALMKRG